MKENGFDVEKGKFTFDPSNNIPWSKIIGVMFAVAVLIAACAVAWIFQNWQTSLQVLAILVVVYFICFYWRWLYVAARTTPRDFS